MIFAAQGIGSSLADAGTSRRLSDMSSHLSCVKVAGGITNALFCMMGFGTLGPSIGKALFPNASPADGDRRRELTESLVDLMIDRDLEWRVVGGPPSPQTQDCGEVFFIFIKIKIK